MPHDSNISKNFSKKTKLLSRSSRALFFGKVHLFRMTQDVIAAITWADYPPEQNVMSSARAIIIPYVISTNAENKQVARR